MSRLAKTFALAACVAAFAFPAMAQTKWNLPAAYPADNPHSENLVLFAKDVAAATGGKLQITVHPAASLFKAPDIKRAVQTGQAQIGEVLLSIHENEDPLFGIDVIPFLATSYPEAKKLWDASRPAIEKNEDPLFGIDVIPFLATSYPEAKKLGDASSPAIEKKLNAQGLKLLFAV